MESHLWVKMLYYTVKKEQKSKAPKNTNASAFPT